jgi:hypothetical protein
MLRMLSAYLDELMAEEIHSGSCESKYWNNIPV